MSGPSCHTGIGGPLFVVYPGEPEDENMKETPLRDHLVGARMRANQKDLVVLAARQEGVTISELVRTAVLESTARILAPRS